MTTITRRVTTTTITRLYDYNDGDHEALRCQRRRSRGSTTPTTEITRLDDANDEDHEVLRLQRRRWSRGSMTATTTITRLYDANDGDHEALRLQRRKSRGPTTTTTTSRRYHFFGCSFWFFCSRRFQNSSVGVDSRDCVLRWDVISLAERVREVFSSSFSWHVCFGS